MPLILLLAIFSSAMWAAAGDDASAIPARVDVQIFNAKQILIPDLQPKDLELRVDGKVVPIANFSGETAPLDVLFLIDVNVAMKPNVQQLVDAAEAAFRALRPQDRVAILAFDVNVRPRQPFTSDHSEILQGLNSVLHTEHFLGTARVTSSLIVATSYLQRHARPEARRAIVILSDNATQDSEDEARVEQALQRTDATLSFLFADHKPRVDEDGDPIPEKREKHRHQDTDQPEVVHAAPYSPLHSAGTEWIAQDSGGDAVDFKDEYILEDALLHLRQRYTLRFDPLPADDKKHEIRVDLTNEARTHFPDAVIHFRLLFTPGSDMENILTPITSVVPADVGKHRRTAVNEDSSGAAAQKVDPKDY